MTNKIFSCKFIDTTNPRFRYKIGEESNSAQFRDNVFLFNDLYTSYVIEVQDIEDKLFKIKTRNSEYVFKILDDTVFKNFKVSDKKINEIEEKISQAKIGAKLL